MATGDEELLRRCGVELSELSALSIDPTVLAAIHADHVSRIEQLRVHGDFVLGMLQRVSTAHSLKLRVKHPAHLLRKIVRKRREGAETAVGLENYTTEITDLIGVRALHLYKNDWLSLHNFITSTWETVERPVAYVRKGDDVHADLSAHCEVKEHPRDYRSIHYVIRWNPSIETVLAEIQVRTLFEEAWSEIDHKLNYPVAADPLIGQLLRIFNGLAGYADQLGTYIAGLEVSRNELAGRIASKDAERDKLLSDLEKVRKAKKETDAEKALLKRTIEHLEEERGRATNASSRFSSGAGLLGNAFEVPDLTSHLPKFDPSSFGISNPLTTLSKNLYSVGPLAGQISTCRNCGTIYPVGADVGGLCLECAVGKLPKLGPTG